MLIKNIVSEIALKHKEVGIDLNKPACDKLIKTFEEKIGFDLPDDFKDFYSICNGFSCNEDLFNMIPIDEIIKQPEDHGIGWFCFSEYMIYSDSWSLRKTAEGMFEIINDSDSKTALTSSLKEFLITFLKGEVFKQDGLYEWQDKIRNR